MRQRLVERLIGVRKTDIFPNHANSHFAFRVGLTINDVVPTAKIGLAIGFKAECPKHFIIKPFCMILQRHSVYAFRIQRWNNRLFTDITECGNLSALCLRQWMFAAAQQKIGLNTQGRQLAHTVLCWLGLQFTRGGYIRN